MDSATKSTCIKEFAKLNGQSVCDVLNVTVAKMPLSISTSSNNESSINHKKTNTTDDTIINLVSPTPPEVCQLQLNFAMFACDQNAFPTIHLFLLDRNHYDC